MKHKCPKFQKHCIKGKRKRVRVNYVLTSSLLFTVLVVEFSQCVQIKLQLTFAIPKNDKTAKSDCIINYRSSPD